MRFPRPVVLWLCCPLLAAPALAGVDAERTAVEAPPTASQSAALPIADRVVVFKHDRQLQLSRRGEVLRSYRISLGLQPDGAKERSGDFRTPEGSYRLTRRNSRSDYFLSIQVSYPNAEDMKNARRRGWKPGGSVMVHGLPNTLRHPPGYYTAQDWTDGCIALSNADMVEFWLLSHDNMPIQIMP